MSWIDRENIILTGIKHSGKTSVGKLLAERLDRQFIDIDRIIESLYDNSGRVTCREIYRSHGREYFRSLETEAAERISAHYSRKGRLVIALGGGLIENSRALTLLKNAGIFIYLKELPEVLFKRIEKHGIPPFLDKKNPKESFFALHEKRSNLLENHADIIFPANGRSVYECAEAIEQMIETRQ